jgi:hypothetical protein
VAQNHCLENAFPFFLVEDLQVVFPVFPSLPDQNIFEGFGVWVKVAALHAAGVIIFGLDGLIKL